MPLSQGSDTRGFVLNHSLYKTQTLCFLLLLVLSADTVGARGGLRPRGLRHIWADDASVTQMDL